MKPVNGKVMIPISSLCHSVLPSLIIVALSYVKQDPSAGDFTLVVI